MTSEQRMTFLCGPTTGCGKSMPFPPPANCPHCGRPTAYPQRMTITMTTPETPTMQKQDIATLIGALVDAVRGEKYVCEHADRVAVENDIAKRRADLLDALRERDMKVDPANAVGWCCHCTKERATTTRVIETSLCEPCASTVDGNSPQAPHRGEEKER